MQFIFGNIAKGGRAALGAQDAIRRHGKRDADDARIPANARCEKPQSKFERAIVERKLLAERRKLRIGGNAFHL